MISRHCRCPGCGICEAAEAIEPLKKERTVLRKSLKEEKQRYKELSQMTESYIKRLHATEEENKRLRKALQTISNGMDINPPEPIRESIIDYFKRIAEAALKNGG
jgi:chromosome segregation ATPase